MRKREMASASSSQLVGEQHQTPELQMRLTSLGELTWVPSFFPESLSSLGTDPSQGLETVTVVCMQSFAPPAPFSKVQTAV